VRFVGDAVGGVAVPVPDGSSAADAGSPVDADRMAVEADWAAGDGWAVDAECVGGDGWAADWWGDVWPLGGPAASAVLPVLSVEPDRPVERPDLAAVAPGPVLAHELASRCPSEVSAADWWM
jgi:hypothetical protein